MQSSQPITAKNATWVTTYGPFTLSAMAILVIAIAWFLRVVDQTMAITVIGVILGGNGIVSATQWQAAPGLISELQQLIGALMGHIQALHQAQQVQGFQQSQPQQPFDQEVTAKVASLAPPVTPTPASAPASPDQSLLVSRQQLFPGQQPQPPRPMPGG